MTTTNQGAFDRNRDLSNGETYVARLTPIGRAAVSVVGVSGGTAWELLRSRWTDSNGVPASADDARWTLQKAERPFFGLFHFDALGGVADEVVLYWRTPDSFEIDCHGGDLATSRIVDFFESNAVLKGKRRGSLFFPLVLLTICSLPLLTSCLCGQRRKRPRSSHATNLARGATGLFRFRRLRFRDVVLNLRQ